MGPRHTSVIRWAAFGLALLAPVSACWFVGPTLAPGVEVAHYARAGVYPADLPALVMLVAGLMIPQPLRRAGGPGRIAAPMVGLASLGLATAPGALSLGLASYTVLRWLVAVGVYVVLASGDVSTDAWAAALVVGLALQACVGIAQVATQGPLGLPGELALPSQRWGAAVLTVGGRPWLRAYGWAFHPNVLGGWLAVGLLVSLPLLDRLWMRPLWWLLSVGLAVTFSRSAWLAAGLVLPPLAGWLGWRRPELRRGLGVTVGGAAVIALLVALLLGGQLVSRLRPSESEVESRSLSERGALMQVAMELIGERPLAGVGAGNFSLAMRGANQAAEPQPVHNVPLLLAAEVGVLGGVFWYWLWLAPGLMAGPLLREGPTWPVVLALAWFAVGLVGLWDHYPWALNSGRLLSASLLGQMAGAWDTGQSG